MLREIILKLKTFDLGVLTLINILYQIIRFQIDYI